MSLYLPEQKLGSHSEEGGSSNKFVLKGRQTGSMHRGHTWVFRAESHDTMMAWYEDIKTLTERTPEERSNLVRANSRSLSRSSQRSSLSSDGVGDDEDPPFMATTASVTSPQQPRQDALQRRPSGGRFPSDLQVNAQRGLQVPTSPISVSSEHNEYSERHPGHDVIAAAGALPGSDFSQQGYESGARLRQNDAPRQAYNAEFTTVRSPGINNPGQRRVAEVYKDRSGDSGGAVGDLAYTSSNGSQQAYQTVNGIVWAEPVPVPVPVSTSQAQTLSDRADAGNEQIYTTQHGGAIVSGRDSGKSWTGEEGTQREMNGGEIIEDEKQVRPPGVTTRTDSTPTISHLHIPGEYPKATTTGFRDL